MELKQFKKTRLAVMMIRDLLGHSLLGIGLDLKKFKKTPLAMMIVAPLNAKSDA